MSTGPPIVGNSKPAIQISCESKFWPTPLKISWARIIGVLCGDLLRICGFARMCTKKCLQVNQGVMLKMALRGLFEDPLGENKGTRGAMIGTMNKRKNVLALGRGHTKPIR